MECGAGEVLCFVSEWISSNESHLKEVVSPVVTLLEQAFGSDGWLLNFLRAYGEKLIAAASFAFAVWRWLVYREGVLHKRLESYIRESDQRLEPTSRDLTEAILRPGRTARLPQPAYALELNGILRRRWRNGSAWSYWVGLSALEDATSWRLGRRLGGIRKRMSTARKAMTSLQDQQAHLHIIAGSIAAAKARRIKDPKKANRHDLVALREFQKVLNLPGHHRDVAAKESEAFQLLRLGRHDLALIAYKELERLSDDEADQQRMDIIAARAKRYQAQIAQCPTTVGAGDAWSLLAAPNRTSALELRKNYQPFKGWDEIEQAEMHYLAAYIAHKRGYPDKEPQQLRLGEIALRELLEPLPKRRWFVNRPTRALRTEARAALNRVERAQRAVADKYDLDWLGVPS